MQVKDEEKIGRIYDSTLTLVTKVGLAGVSMAAIAKDSKIATGTIYIYFTNKEVLFVELYKDIKRRFSASVFGNYKQGSPVKQTLRAMWESYILFSVSHYREHIFLQQFNYSPYIQKNEALKFAQKTMRPLIEVIKGGQEQQLIKADEQQVILHLLAGFVNQAVLLAQQDRAAVNAAFIEGAFNFFWDAIKQ